MEMKTKTTKGQPIAESALPALMKKFKIDQAKLDAHVMRPAHVQGVISYNRPPENGLDRAHGNGRKPGRPPKPGSKSHLDVDAFADALDAALKNNTVGFCMRLQKDGKTIRTLDRAWAQTPDDDSLTWTASRRMHVASVSKLITAMAMTKLLLDHKDVSKDDKIIDFLPTQWVKGPNINKITFRNLLTHTSGFNTGHGDTDYEAMKLRVQMGVSTDPDFTFPLGVPEKSKYENMNFGLCRILLPIVNGDLNKDMVYSDNVWDILATAAYAAYVQTKVFGPSGVKNATLDHPANSVLAYYFPRSESGWDSGDLMSVSGGAGWHLSISDLLKVMSTFRRKGTIMSSTAAQKMLDNKFGIEDPTSTPAGTLYHKGGLWRTGSEKGVEIYAEVEQCVAYFLPEDMEMAVFVNSYIGLPPKDLSNLVTDLYVNNLN
jgi:CubicO group peptidase (beta-lactamase class C family)